MSYEDDVVAYAEQFKERWLKAMDEAVLAPGYRTIYSMDAQEAVMVDKEGANETVARLMDKLVGAVCTAIDYGNVVPSQVNVVLRYEGYDIDIAVSMRKRGPDGPEENSPQED